MDFFIFSTVRYIVVGISYLLDENYMALNLSKLF